MSTITEELQRLRETAEKATPGPWTVQRNDSSPGERWGSRDLRLRR